MEKKTESPHCEVVRVNIKYSEFLDIPPWTRKDILEKPLKIACAIFLCFMFYF
jgi:hypothetical protein